MQDVRDKQVSGEGASKPPAVVGKLGSDGQWHVLMTVPVPVPLFVGEHEVLLDADQAERLARNLIEYAALVREKLGLPGGAPFP
jgi:hypothetical protein